MHGAKIDRSYLEWRFMFKRFQILGAALLLIPGAAMAQAPATTSTAMSPGPATNASPGMAVAGVWRTPDDKSLVRVYRNPDGTFDGRIVWLKKPIYPQDYKDKSLAGRPKVDIHNPDKKLRSRPVLGMDVLTGFKYSPADHDWRKGKCYDPEEGKTYTCRMWLKDHDTLMVRGYVWIFHKTQEWRRAQEPTPPATAPTAASVH